MSLAAGSRSPTPPLVTVDLWRVPARRVGPALAHLALDRVRLRRVPGLVFAKLVGTSAPGAFGPWDAEPRRWGLVAAWDSEQAADAFPASAVARWWARAAEEHLRLRLRPVAARGRWSGREPFGHPTPAQHPTPGQHPAAGHRSAGHDPTAGHDPAAGRDPAAGQDPTAGHRSAGEAPPAPVAVLTRARLAPRHAVAFWRAAPPVAAELAALAADPVAGPLLAIGLGEAPVGLQGTFSVWPDLAAVRAFAYGRPAHADVVRRTPETGWYAEELFARFTVLAADGTLDGRNPLRPDSR
jgi:hypothetical protein